MKRSFAAAILLLCAASHAQARSPGGAMPWFAGAFEGLLAEGRGPVRMSVGCGTDARCSISAGAQALRDDPKLYDIGLDAAQLKTLRPLCDGKAMFRASPARCSAGAGSAVSRMRASKKTVTHIDGVMPSAASSACQGRTSDRRRDDAALRATPGT